MTQRRPSNRLTPALPYPLLEKGKAETPIAFIQAIVHAYEARGLSPSAALEKAQIKPKILQQKKRPRHSFANGSAVRHRHASLGRRSVGMV